MTTLSIFIVFALSLAAMAEYLRPYAPLLRLAPVVACPTCGKLGWSG